MSREALRGHFWVVISLVLFAVGCRSGSRVVADADGITVTEGELRQLLWERYGARALRELLEMRILEREGKRRGVTVTRQEVKEELKRRGLPDRKWARLWVRRELLLDKLTLAMVTVTEEEARRYFERYRRLFEEPERVRLRDITLETKKNAEAIWEALKLRGGKNFAALARHFSVNPATNKRGGDMGIVPVEDLHPKLQAVVKKLRPGEFSRPIEVDGEWVIVKLEERFPMETKTFGEVREQVIARLKEQKAWQLRIELPRRLWRDYRVRIYDPSLRSP